MKDLKNLVKEELAALKPVPVLNLSESKCPCCGKKIKLEHIAVGQYLAGCGGNNERYPI